MDELQQIKEILSDGQIAEAIAALDEYIQLNPSSEDAFILRGNAYRRLDNWKMAITNYATAMELNPQGKGAVAYKQAIEIMNFFNTDLYNP